MRCNHCDGLGWTVVVVPAHDPRCDGTCYVGCPIPVEEQEECKACCGTGEGPEPGEK